MTTKVGLSLTKINQTPGEVSTGVVPTNYEYSPYPYDVRRAGLVPNSQAHATSNSVALKKLLDPTKAGPTGLVFFPNTTGSDIYHFDGIRFDIRDGVTLDLGGCTIKFTRTYEASDNTFAFFNCIRRVTIQNGKIDIDYDGSPGINCGSAIMIGSRSGYAFGQYTSGISDEQVAADPQGNCVVRNLYITSNNPMHLVVMMGGLRNTLFENVVLDGQNVAIEGIYYEFGFWSKVPPISNYRSSHATNMSFRNIRIANVNGNGLSIIGAYNCEVNQLQCENLGAPFVFRPGEALFWKPGGIDASVTRRSISVRNVTSSNCSSGISLRGAESASSGYLASQGLTAAEQTDLMGFVVDGFSLEGPIFVQGASTVSISNGSITETGKGATVSGAIILSDEVMHFDINNVEIRDSLSAGIRAAFGQAIWSPARLKQGAIRNCKIVGCAAGITIQNSRSVIIEGNQIGYSTDYDGQNETTQVHGVLVNATGEGVVCRDNFVYSPTNAYVLQGTGDRRCAIYSGSPRATTGAVTGTWGINGVPSTHATAIGQASNTINQTDKYTGKMIWDSSNSRLMYALGATSTSGWRVADGSLTVTPA